MNIYEKMNKAKKMLLESNLKKSGENKFAGFKYYELADFTPRIIEICNELGLHTQITFDQEETRETAILRITNVEEPKEWLTFESPMRDLSLKGCNEIQALGGVETYSRRYLYMTAFDIIESDMFDAKSGTSDNEEKITKTQIAKITEMVEDIPAMLNYYKINKIEEMTKKDAETLIKRKSK